MSILNDHCFRKPRAGVDSLHQTSEAEADCLSKLVRRGPVFIDVPIDLHELPSPDDAEFIWQLTKRPVDQAFGALPPLADRIGSYVARMQNIWRKLCVGGVDPLGRTVFETYPAASLRLSKRCCEGYKGTSIFHNNAWVGLVDHKSAAEQRKSDTLATMLNELRWSAGDAFELTNDEFDAAICALTGLFEQFKGAELDAEINARLHGTNCKAPRGYVLLRNLPASVNLSRKSF